MSNATIWQSGRRNQPISKKCLQASFINKISRNTEGTGAQDIFRNEIKYFNPLLSLMFQELRNNLFLLQAVYIILLLWFLFLTGPEIQAAICLHCICTTTYLNFSSFPGAGLLANNSQSSTGTMILQTEDLHIQLHKIKITSATQSCIVLANTLTDTPTCKPILTDSKWIGNGESFLVNL